MRKYHGIPAKGPLTDAQARTAIHGYWAATSYVDAMVGQLLDELKRLELRQETIVILWGDHGWQLGEHGFWCKHTNYEVAARVPLVISIPGQIQRGSHCHRLVEFVDIFPTLADACGLPTPAGLDGISFVPLVENPQLRWKQAAFHLYPRSIPEHGPGVGYAIRTDRYRLVKWSATKSSFHEYELYDLHTDPEENTNLAHLPESQRLVQQLSNQLEAGWRKALPK